MKNEHPFKSLKHNGRRVKIDTEIVPLIRQLWDMGLETTNSCQDNFGYVWIEFFGAVDAETFLTVCAQSADEELGWRAREPFSLSPHERHRLREFHAHEDSWLIAANTHDLDSGEVWISVGIRFPRDHLARVMSALRQEARPQPKPSPVPESQADLFVVRD